MQYPAELVQYGLGISIPPKPSSTCSPPTSAAGAVSQLAVLLPDANVGSVAIGAESERDRDKRRHQRTLFNDIAERYEESRPGYPARVAEFVDIGPAMIAPARRPFREQEEISKCRRR